MESKEQQQQSSSNIDNIDSNMDKELPFVDALVTPTPGTNLRGTLTHVATLQKLQEKEREIKQHLKHIQELNWTIDIQAAQQQNLIAERTISRLPSSPPDTSEQLGHAPSSLLPAQAAEIMQEEQALQLLIDSLALKKHAYAQQRQAQSPEPRLPAETPGPHRLQHRPERPEDMAYRQQQRDQQEAEQDTAMNQSNSSQDDIVNVFKSLTKVLSDNNKQLHSNDVSDPPKFNGQDSNWDDWYLQWRTYLEAKGWLTTFEHATGPGTIGFDNDVNKKIYNKLLSLCQKGTAATYVTKAANFNGWEAAKYLLERYEGFSKQRQRSLRQLIENLRHVNGTNMSRHVDKFERICGQMAHNNPTKPPNEEQKIDWFFGLRNGENLRLCPRSLHGQAP